MAYALKRCGFMNHLVPEPHLMQKVSSCRGNECHRKIAIWRNYLCGDLYHRDCALVALTALLSTGGLYAAGGIGALPCDICRGSVTGNNSFSQQP